MGVTIKNLGRLQAKLDKLDPVTRSAAYRGVGKAGALVHGHAVNIVPVSTERTRPGGPHGELKQSLTVEVKQTLGGAEATVGSSKEYAMYVELGTSKMRAQPYLRPALQKNKNAARKLIMTEIVKAHKGL